MAQFLRDLLRNGYNGVKPIETVEKKKGLGQRIKDVATAELDKNGPRVLFYKRLPTLYGSDLVRISTKGSVEPARTLTVRGARYVDTNNAGGGGFARFLGNLLGGSANRPSDTIFPANDQGQGIASEPPVSINGQPINGDWNGLKYAVEAGKNYAVSQEPAGKNALTGLLKGNPSDIARNAAGAITGAAKNAVKNIAVNALTSRRKNAIGDLSDKLKKSANLNTTVRVPNTKEKPGSKFIKVKDGVLGIPKLIDVKQLGLKERNYLIDTILQKESLVNYARLKDIVEQNTGNNLQFIKIKKEGTGPNEGAYLLFPATITDVQDNMTPEWSSFKYVGSPFNTYRYTGVERKISFDFRVYYIENGDQIVMRNKLNLLRELVYPSTNVTSINLTGTEYTPIVFKPNTIQLSIGALYNNLKGFISNLSITVPQEAPWATSNPNFLKENVNMVYPTFVDVSFEMTIIENHILNPNEGITYRFDDVEEKDPRPTLQTPNVSSLNGVRADNGYNDVGIKTQFQKNREIDRLADFANPGLTNSIYGKGGIVKWDAFKDRPKGE
jgi:hypothetical protein